MKKKDFFKIGELSKLFGIGVDSIRYYEEIGILHPQRNPENNYRLYTVEDVHQLTIIRELLKLNFSTEQIREYTTHKTLRTTLDLLDKELAVVNDEILRYYETKNNIQDRISTIKKMMSLDGDEQVHMLTLPDRKCIMVTDSNLPDSYVSYYLVKYMHSKNLHIDTIGASDCYTLDLPGSNPNSLYYRTQNVFFYSPSLPQSECN